jgi:hypothetical protein
VAGSHLALERLVVKAGAACRVSSYAPGIEERAGTVMRQAEHSAGSGSSARYPGGAAVSAPASNTATTTAQPTAPIAEWGSCAVRQYEGEGVCEGPGQFESVRWDVFLRKPVLYPWCAFQRYPLHATAQLAKDFEMTFATSGIDAQEVHVCFTVEARMRRFCRGADAEDRPRAALGARYSLSPATATLRVPTSRECLAGAHVHRAPADIWNEAASAPPAASAQRGELSWTDKLAQAPPALPPMLAPTSALARCLFWCCLLG